MQGVAFLAAGDYAKAEASFKKAIQPDVDSTAPLAYLAASFAAAGQDHEAASAWQTALVDGSDLPQIYEWLGDALMRTHDSARRARCSRRRPASGRPIRASRSPLAMLYATFGRGREAVRTLERYLTDRPDDRDALYLAVEWLYTVHAAGGVVHNRAEDRKRAHDYADAYASTRAAGGPRQTVDGLSGSRRSSDRRLSA